MYNNANSRPCLWAHSCSTLLFIDKKRTTSAITIEQTHYKVKFRHYKRPYPNSLKNTLILIFPTCIANVEQRIFFSSHCNIYHLKPTSFSAQFVLKMFFVFFFWQAHSKLPLNVKPYSGCWAWCPRSQQREEGMGRCGVVVVGGWGRSEIIPVRISLILGFLIRALLEWLKSGQSVAAEAVALALLACIRAGPCVLQISLISLLMDCPAPGSVSGRGASHSTPTSFSQGHAKLGTHFKLPLHLLPPPPPPHPPLSPCSVLCWFQPRLRGGTPSVLSRSMEPTPLSSSQLGYGALWDSGFALHRSPFLELQAPVWRTTPSPWMCVWEKELMCTCENGVVGGRSARSSILGQWVSHNVWVRGGGDDKLSGIWGE